MSVSKQHEYATTCLEDAQLRECNKCKRWSNKLSQNTSVKNQNGRFFYTPYSCSLNEICLLSQRAVAQSHGVHRHVHWGSHCLCWAAIQNNSELISASCDFHTGELLNESAYHESKYTLTIARAFKLLCTCQILRGATIMPKAW